MAILLVGPERIESIEVASLVEEGIRERADLQRLLLASIHNVMPDVMLIAEEYSNWADSKRRIDILGLDKDARLVVIELKRTEDGGHMELQALRYAAMASPMTFDHVVDAHQHFLTSRGRLIDPREAILDFLGWEEPDEEQFALDVRIVLLSCDFSREISTTVLWLNSKGLDIRCIRLTPYKLADRLLVDVQQIIPLPEAAEFQTRLREKELTKTAARTGRGFTLFDLNLSGELHSGLPKRNAVLAVFKHLVASGIPPESVANAIGFRKLETVLVSFPGDLAEEEVRAELQALIGPNGSGRYRERRWFSSDDELLRFGGRTYALTNQWGPRTELALRSIAAMFPDHGVAVTTHDGFRQLRPAEALVKHFAKEPT